MQLNQNDDTFAIAVQELAVRFIQGIAICLHKSPDVAFDVTRADAANSDLLFDICFKGAIEFEEQSGIEVVGTKYTPRVVFDSSRFNNVHTILIGSSLVHGMIDSPQLAEGVMRARRSVNGDVDDK